MNEFKRARDILAGIKDAEKKYKCEWGNIEDVVFYKSKVRLDERKRLLDRLVPDRVCSICEKLRISNKSWVMNKEKTSVICRSCCLRKFGKIVEEISFSHNLFNGIQFRVAVKGQRVAQLREELEITQREFSRQCGWSKGYQGGLENGKFKTISQMAAETIIEVFSNHGVVCKDVL